MINKKQMEVKTMKRIILMLGILSILLIAGCQKPQSPQQCIQSSSNFCGNNKFETNIEGINLIYRNEIPENLISCSVDYCLKKFPKNQGWICRLDYGSVAGYTTPRLMDGEDLYAINCETLEKYDIII